MEPRGEVDLATVTTEFRFEDGQLRERMIGSISPGYWSDECWASGWASEVQRREDGGLTSVLVGENPCRWHEHLECELVE